MTTSGQTAGQPMGDNHAYRHSGCLDSQADPGPVPDDPDLLLSTHEPQYYPVSDPGGDGFGLTVDVARVLAAHGYADATDFVDLQQALYRFIHRDRS